jgi:transglutaminase-like putative cysteine protease
MLRTPPLLLGATLAFWGWQTGFLVLGLALGVAVELSRWVKVRWHFSPEDYNQLWNITVMMFLGAAAFAFMTQEGTTAVGNFFGARSFTERSRAMDQAARTVMTFLQWLPMVFFPFLAAQAYGNLDKIDFRTFSWFLRRKAAPKHAMGDRSGKGLNVAFPFFAVTVVSSSTVNQASLRDQVVFYVALCFLVGWSMWPRRSRRFALPIWIGLMAAAWILGAGGALVLRNRQKVAEALQTQWLSNVGTSGRETTDVRTSLGQVGRLKGSGAIVMRVEIPPEAPMTPLLRSSTYTFFRGANWSWGGTPTSRVFGQTFSDTNENWVLLNAPATRPVVISAYLDGGRGPLPLPHGVARINHLAVFDLKTNAVATVRVDEGRGLVTYEARAATNATFDGAPDQTFDLDIPTNELAAISRVAGEMKLGELPEAQRPRAIEAFFSKYFSYTLYQEEAMVSPTNHPDIRTPLSYFLLKKRAGHCEYFATATVLLLRQAGIPARYTVGYSVQESAGKNRFVVRARHAHAWCLYYDRAAGRWRELDTTPGTWLAAEEEHKSIFEPVRDAFSWVYYQFSRLRWGDGNLRQYLFYVVMVVMVAMVIRFARSRRRRAKAGVGPTAMLEGVMPGRDSEFYLVEKKLVRMGLARRTGEPLGAWLERIETHLPAEAAALRALLVLHYRLRFDPLGLAPAERTTLREQAGDWLRKAEMP